MAQWANSIGLSVDKAMPIEGEPTLQQLFATLLKIIDRETLQGENFADGKCS